MIDWTDTQVRKMSVTRTLKGVVLRSPLSEAPLPPTLHWLFGEGWPGKDAGLEVFRSALLEMDKLGETHACRGGFWRDLMFVAQILGFDDLGVHFRQRFRAALLRLAAKKAERA
jgi:hypothetical protein